MDDKENNKAGGSTQRTKKMPIKDDRKESHNKINEGSRKRKQMSSVLLNNINKNNVESGSNEIKNTISKPKDELGDEKKNLPNRGVKDKDTKGIRKGAKNKNKTTSDRELDKRRERVRNNVRKYREKMTIEQLEEKRKKDRERYRLKKEQGLVKSIADYSEREKRHKRRAWKVNSQSYRNRITAQKRSVQFMENETPPISDAEEVCPEPVADSRKLKGRKKVKRDRAQAYRKLAKAEQQIEMWKRKAEKYKKRTQRLGTVSTSKSKPSPKTRVKNILQGIAVPLHLKKSLLYGEVLQDVLKENLNSTKCDKHRQVFNKVVSSKLLNKYKLVGKAKGIISYKMHSKFKDNLNVTVYERKKRNCTEIREKAKKIQEFLENDENSRMCPGKKDYVRKKKVKKQKRLLLDSMKNLYNKFVQSSGTFTKSLSYTTFCRLKPFWIVRPKDRDRDTCMCIKHSNITLIAEALFHKKLIPTKKPDDVLKQLVCNTESRMCMFKLCRLCRNKKYLIGNLKSLNDEIKYQQWKIIYEERTIKDKVKKVKITTKTNNITTVSGLFRIFNQQLGMFQRHVFTMRHQMKQMQEIKKNTNDKTLAIHIDFSENYVAKFSKEIQSVHFGASKKQISLHTGVYYINEQSKGYPFCSVSDNLDHQAHAVWAHMKTLLEKLSLNYPQLSNIHFFSDGPTSQYRNRFNIYFLLTLVPTIFPKVNQISWNFSESGHGKGPMDGVGGVLKRSADRCVLHGQDITSASVFVERVKEVSIELWEVPQCEIHKMKQKIPKINAIPKIMSANQIIWSIKKPSDIFLRELSCFTCDVSKPCTHYSMKPASIKFFSEEHFYFFLNSITATVVNARRDDSDSFSTYLSKEKHIVNTSNEQPSTSKTYSAEEKPLNETSGAAAGINKKINIISNTLLSDAVKTTYSSSISSDPNIYDCITTKSLCYICTLNLSCSNVGIKCKNCPRTYHVSCVKKNFKNYFFEYFLCKVCQK